MWPRRRDRSVRLHVLVDRVTGLYAGPRQEDAPTCEGERPAERRATFGAASKRRTGSGSHGEKPWEVTREVVKTLGLRDRAMPPPQRPVGMSIHAYPCLVTNDD
jgi:hypothetical protein